MAISGILLNEFPLYSKAENSLAEGGDMFRADGDFWKMTEAKLRVFTRGFCVGSVSEVMQGCRREPIPAGLALRVRSLQTITQCHQFVNLGDDATLFTKWWKREQ